MNKMKIRLRQYWISINGVEHKGMNFYKDVERIVLVEKGTQLSITFKNGNYLVYPMSDIVSFWIEEDG